MILRLGLSYSTDCDVKAGVSKNRRTAAMEFLLPAPMRRRIVCMLRAFLQTAKTQVSSMESIPRSRELPTTLPRIRLAGFVTS